MISKFLRIASVLSLLLGGGIEVSAQSFQIDSYVIAGGGGTSTNTSVGGNFVVSGTIGQPSVGAMSGGNFAINSGFWSLNVAVQVTGSPLLSLSTAGGFVTLSWPTNETGFRLETTSALGPGANWQPVSGVSNNSVSIPISISAQPASHYYRLISP